MPEPTTWPRRTRAARAAVAAVAATGLLAACSGGHHPAPEPGAVNAIVVAHLTAATPVAKAVTAPANAPGAVTMSSGSDGALLLAVPGYVARLGLNGTLGTVASGTGDAAPTGVVGLPDGSFVTASGGRLTRLIPGRKPGILAGAAGAPRAASAPVPVSASVTAVHFTRSLTPVGTVSDGSLILADGDAVWRLRTGRVTRVYQGSLLGRDYAVSPDGTLYLVPRGTGATLRKTLVVSPAGHTAALRLPATLAGVGGAPGDLVPLAESSDGQDGLYVHAVRLSAGRTTGDYVLHLTGGTATLTAASSAPGAARGCAVTGSAPARRFPCPLPQAITAQPGLLVLAGGTTYAVGIRMPQPSASGTPKP